MAIRRGNYRELTAAGLKVNTIKMKDTWKYTALLLVLSIGFAQQDATTTEKNATDIPFEDTEGRCSNDTETPMYEGRICACDPDCRKYGDCCLDSPFYKPEEQKLGASPFTCSSVATVEYNYYIISKCPSDWDDPVVRYHCENPDTTLPDPLRDTPITSLTTNFSYVNSYCAACHRDLHPDTMEIWAVKITCPRILNFSDEVYQYLAYDTDSSVWYLSLTADNTTIRHICQLSPIIPAVARFRGRECQQDVVSSCQEDWTDDVVKEQCEAYTSHICYEYYTFRNRYCAVCNNASTGSECLKPLWSNMVAVHRSSSFSELLDWRMMEKTHHCGQREIFDPLSGLCRSVIDVDESEVNLTEALGACNKVSFTSEEYELAEDNSSAYVSVHNKTYYKHEFLIHDELLVVCATEDTEKHFAPELGYFTVIGLSLSILFLVLHLSVFFMVPKLRNFSATNLSCLCISLLLLYCSFIANNSMATRTPGCIVIALLIHYSLLVSFFWMLTISFDIFRVMKQATSKLIISKGRQRLRFGLYCMGSWLLPAVIVGAGLAIDSWCPESHFAPAYGQGACWLNNSDALLIFCVAPLAVVVVFNVCFFWWTAYLIHMNSAEAASASSTRKEFPLFLRLGFIMGITWVTGVVAASVDVPGLWHLFVIFNTLQGLFIFIAFTCTKKVWKEIQIVMHRHKKLITPATTETSLVMQDHQILNK